MDLIVLIMIISAIALACTLSDARASTDIGIAATDTILDASIEDTATPVREADAKVSSKLLIDNGFIDPDNNCELCTRMVYTPGSIAEAGIAYKDDTVDLGNAERIVFFAKGEQAQEVSFVAAGNATSATNTNDTDIFPRIDFAVATDNVTLKDDWQRFEIGLNGTELSDASYPFGIQMTADSSQKQTFFIKGVTLDTKPAQDPLPTVFDSLSNSTEPLTAKIDANSTNSSAPATIEFTANATGGLAPYSMQWNFDGGNSTDRVGQRTLHTFDKPGDYNITLSAEDSGTPSQNASATMLIIINPSANKTDSELANLTMAGTNSTISLDTNATATISDTNSTIGLDTNATATISDTNSTIGNTTAMSVDTNSTNRLNTNGTTSSPGTQDTKSTNDTAPVATSLVGSNSTLVSYARNSTEELHVQNLDQFTTASEKNVTIGKNKTLNIKSLNHPPVAGDQSVTLDANETANIILKGYDQDNDHITFDLTSDPSKGTIVGFDSKLGSLTYVPNPNSAGLDSFTFKAIDIHEAESNEGRVLETVTPVQPNEVTTADLTVATAQGRPVSIVLSAFAQQDQDPLEFALATPPSHGKLSELSAIDQKSSRVTYFPEDGYSGSDVFKFKVHDRLAGTSASGKVSIRVIADPPDVNLAPLASTQNIETEQNKKFSLLLEGTDVDGDKLTFSIVTVPKHGKLVAFDRLAGKITYKPVDRFSGEDTFTFKTTDTKQADSNIAKVSIKVLDSTPNPIPDSNGRQSIMGAPNIGSKENTTIQGSSDSTLESNNLSNQHPSANAGPDRTVYEGTNDVTLKGTARDTDGDRLSYSWEQAAGESVVLSDANTVKPRFSAPDVNGDIVLIFKLTVADGKGGQDNDDVKIRIKDKPNYNNQLVKDLSREPTPANQTSAFAN